MCVLVCSVMPNKSYINVAIAAMIVSAAVNQMTRENGSTSQLLLVPVENGIKICGHIANT